MHITKERCNYFYKVNVYLKIYKKPIFTRKCPTEKSQDLCGAKFNRKQKPKRGGVSFE